MRFSWARTLPPVRVKLTEKLPLASHPLITGQFHILFELPLPEPNRLPLKKIQQRKRQGSSNGAASQTTSVGLVSTTASLTSNVLPRLLRRTLRYAETFSFTTGTAGVVGTIQLMALNDIFDPNITGVGHQPYGHDQLAVWYTKYLVLGTRIRLICTTPGASAEVQVCYKLDSPNGFLSIAGMTNDRVTEAPMIGTAIVSSSGISRVVTVDIKADLPKILGITAEQYRAQYETYGALMTASPTARPTLQIGLASLTGVAAEGAVIQVIMDFDTEFSDPAQLPQS